MRAWMVGGVLGIAACNGGNVKDAVETDYTFDCDVTDPFAIGDIYAETNGREHECEGQPYYIPELGTATAFFIGEFHWDDCGTLQGRETWKLWADDSLVEQGLDDCEVVWDVTGEKGAPVTQGSYSLTFSAQLKTAETTCPDDRLAYEDSFTITYDVVETGATSSFYFGESGNFLGEGASNGNHATYITDLSCLLLGTATF